MNPITIYSKDYCPYCKAAKSLLRQKRVAFTEIDIQFDPDLVQEMRERSCGGHTVPQIFIGEIHVGGATDLMALEDAGRLDALLKPYQKQLIVA